MSEWISCFRNGIPINSGSVFPPSKYADDGWIRGPDYLDNGNVREIIPTQQTQVLYYFFLQSLERCAQISFLDSKFRFNFKWIARSLEVMDVNDYGQIFEYRCGWCNENNRNNLHKKRFHKRHHPEKWSLINKEWPWFYNQFL